MEFSQNMAGRDPTRKNKLKTLSPKIALFPTPRPKAVIICGPNVYMAYMGTTWHNVRIPKNTMRAAYPFENISAKPVLCLGSS